MSALSTVRKTFTRDENTSARVMIARAIAQNAAADELYHVASAEHDPQHRLELLREVLAVDPYYQPAVMLWEQTAQDATRISGKVYPFPSASLAGAVNIFARHGWELKVQLPRIAQLQKPYGLSVRVCALSILVFSIPAMLVVLILNTRRRVARVHLQLESDGVLTLMHNRSATKVESSADLAAFAASVSDGISIPWILFCGALSVIGWMMVL